jgi:DMSO/TMAO reductase YedYZ molybdopterin-dependent catalytic subunit
VEGWHALVKWEGIPLSHLLTLAGAPNNFDHLTIKSVTGYTVTINQHDAMSAGSLIALKAGSLPLTAEHGYPARLVLPNRPGLQWVKSVSNVTCSKA